MRIAIVGAGVVGLSSAYWLRRLGHEVQLLERATLGSGASRGNAGEICPELATPVAKFSLVRSAVTQAYRRDSALHVNPAALPSYAGFLSKVVANALPSRYADNQAALSDLATAARQAFEAIADDVGVSLCRGGYLHVYDTLDKAREGRADVKARLSAAGVSDTVGPLLSPSELAEVEPCLKPQSYGFLYERGTFVDPNVFVDSLWRHLSGHGVTLHEGVTTTHVSRTGRESVVHTDRGDFAADGVVICAGIGSSQIARASGRDVPIRAGKGYSFTIHPLPAPRHVVKFEAAHVALLPLGEGARVAGTMEFDTDPGRFNSRRIHQIVNALRPYLDDAVLDTRTHEWVGARPVTPDGLPLIGEFPHLPNTYLACGHNMLGLMLSPVTGQLVANHIAGGAPLSRAFSPSRF